MASSAQNITGMGPNPFEAVDALLMRMAGRVHNGRDGHGRTLNVSEFREISAAFKAADASPYHSLLAIRQGNDEKGRLSDDWGELSINLCGERTVAFDLRTYTIPQFTRAVVMRRRYPDGVLHSYVDFCTGAMPALVNVDHVQLRVKQRAENTKLDSALLRSMGAYALFLSRMASDFPKFFARDPMPVALPNDDGFFAAHLEPVSDVVPSDWFTSSRTMAERVDGAGIKRRFTRTIDSVEHALFINTFLGLNHIYWDEKIIHAQSIKAFGQPDIVAAINNLFYVHASALQDNAQLKLQPSHLPQHTRDRIEREVGPGGSVEAFVQKLNEADITGAFTAFAKQTAEAAMFLEEKWSSVPRDAIARAVIRSEVAMRMREMEAATRYRERQLGILRANGIDIGGATTSPSTPGQPDVSAVPARVPGVR